MALATLVGIFATRTPGFGRYTTAAILLTLVLVVSAMLFAGGMVEGAIFINVAFAVTRFAGGIVTAKEQ